jgi:WD40 repeat protein/serine/threonine protein kinase
MADLSPDQWRRVETLYAQAAELETGARAAFLDEACRDDAGVRARVDALLGARRRSGGFLATPAGDLSELTGHGEPARDDDGARRLGPWRLLRRIGAGGMGSVWLAERADGRYDRRVAVKLIRSGLDTEEILQRFATEQQVLANLEHANIARLYDADVTADGRPYLVMEHVEGVTIDLACDEGRLSIERRIDLFVKVCDAVEHAHRNLVVHRDLKPGNILVTPEGEPKLLDCGIAKVLDLEGSAAGLDVTVTEARLLTPRYASPEQVRGEPITTASDVYSLGVILYELLTGRSPYRVATRSRGELERIICDQEPARPSTVVARDPAATRPRDDGTEDDGTTTVSIAASRGLEPPRLRRRLAGDLDVILLAALRKEPARRYGSAAALAEDLRRHLSGRPVSARPDTLTYRVGTFVRRHRVPVAAAVAVLLAIVGALVVTSVLYVRADHARVRAEAAEAEAQARSYAASLQAAAGALRERDVVVARRHLDAAPAHLRGWEWRMLHGRLDRSREQWVVPGARPVYMKSALSPDGRLLAAGASDGRVYLWNTATGTLAARFGRHRGSVMALAFSPDGSVLATGEGMWIGGRMGGTTVRVQRWDVARRALIEPPLLGHGDAVQSVAFSPDGRTLASASSDGTVRVWDAATGESLRPPLAAHDGEVRDLAFSPDGAELASVSWDGTLVRWRTRDWSRAGRIELDPTSPRTSGRAVAWSPDGRLIAAGMAGSIRLFDRVTGEPVRVLEGSTPVSLCFAPDGTRLFSSSMDRTVRVWGVAERAGHAVLLGHPHHVNGVHASQDGATLYSVGASGTIRVWSSDQDDVRTLACPPKWMYGAEVSPDGRRIATNWQGTGPDGIRANGVEIRDFADGRLVHRLVGHEQDVCSVRWSADGGRLVSTGADRAGRGEVIVWDAANGDALLDLDGHAGQVWSADFSPDGRWIATAAWDGTVRVWSGDDGRPLAEPIRPGGRRPRIVRFLDDARIVVGSSDGAITFWDAATGRADGAPAVAHDAAVADLAIHGDTLLTGDDDGRAILWDLRDRSPRGELPDHGRPIMCVAISPDGLRLVTGTRNGEIRIWDAAGLRELLSLRASAIRVGFSPDGRWLVSGETAGRVRLWDGRERVTKPGTATDSANR